MPDYIAIPLVEMIDNQLDTSLDPASHDVKVVTNGLRGVWLVMLRTEHNSAVYQECNGRES